MNTLRVIKLGFRRSASHRHKRIRIITNPDPPLSVCLSLRFCLDLGVLKKKPHRSVFVLGKIFRFMDPAQ